MKLLLTAALAAAVSTPALAQDAHAGHAGHTGKSAPAATTARLTIDSPIEALLADAAAKAVVEATLPGLDKHPSYDMAKSMSLKQVQPYTNGAITDEALAKIAAGLAAIK